MIKDRRATGTMFGFDFQVNAAIFLMLENIRELQSIRLEGEEDIDINLEGNRKIIAQAKSVVRSSDDFSNVRANLKKALETLSEADSKINPEKLIYITNSLNPFKDEESRKIFYGPTKRSFSDLPVSAQNIIKEYINKINTPLNAEKLYVYFFPFETDDDEERYKVVVDKIRRFLVELNIADTVSETLLHKIWNSGIFRSGVKKDKSAYLKKKNIIWPIIVIETDINNIKEDDVMDGLGIDIGIYEEIAEIYKNLINSSCERFEFLTKVLYDYNLFCSRGKSSKSHIKFIDTHWEKYKDEFSMDNMNSELTENLTKIIMYNIIRRMWSIKKIKEGTSL